jgi:hypothetical protein
MCNQFFEIIEKKKGLFIILLLLLLYGCWPRRTTQHSHIQNIKDYEHLPYHIWWLARRVLIVGLATHTTQNI